jgi:hypothetical protein
MLLRYHDNIIGIARYHVIMTKLSCYNDTDVMLLW